MLQLDCKGRQSRGGHRKYRIPRKIGSIAYTGGTFNAAFAAHRRRNISRILRGSTSTNTAHNTMRRWNLHFLDATGENAETFLFRIEKRRELIPVSDDDILRCLPFFLSGLALHWFRETDLPHERLLKRCDGKGLTISSISLRFVTKSCIARKTNTNPSSITSRT